ncbi:hypothetical protein [Helicobacter sp. 13S00477-4]|uniref:coiled-coil domain-containing protein n=1 Tax=Helicobacter sp. 13S00477-4 TaxID=1905759 RepID=UPI000BA5B9F7|nr:hypothetical protein [Helicobacter sp. 13S00477-4]PAF51965.1 hypothetical protein BKH44_04705 [Helicobacter sp. 13S00477-4]
MDCSLLYTITLDMLEQGRAVSKNMIEFNQNIIANLSFKIKRILQEHSIDTTSKDCKEYVRKAIADFYRKNGMSAFVHISKDKNIQVRATIRDNKNNLCISFLSQWLEENKKKFKSKISDNESPSQEDFQMILEYAKLCIDFNNEMALREIIRNAIKKTFNLNTRDGLFFNKLGVYFKIFDFNFVKISNEIRNMKKLGAARILDDGDRLKINAYLRKINLEELILKNVDYVLNSKMNLENISNIEFSRNFLFCVTQEFRMFLQKILIGKIPSILQTCFADEKIRASKNIIFESVSKRLLEMLYHNSKAAEKFISFYRFRTICVGDEEINVLGIIDTRGEEWDLEKIRMVVTQKYAIKSHTDEMQDKLEKINQKILVLEKEINEFLEQIALTETLLSEKDLIYERKKKELQTLRDEDIIQKETVTSSLAKYLEDKKNFLNEIEILNEKINEIKIKKTQLSQEQRNMIEDIEKTSEENQISFIQYDMLVNALSNAIGGVKFES